MGCDECERRIDRISYRSKDGLVVACGCEAHCAVGDGEGGDGEGVTSLADAMREISEAERDLARAALRRFANEQLSPAELALEIERWEQQRALLTSDKNAQDYSEFDSTIACRGHRLCRSAPR
jgi:hypothetical protein